MKITIQLDWKKNAQFAGLLLAQHRGWFEESGLDVEILPWTPATNPVQELPNHRGLIAVSEDNLAIQLAAAGHETRILGSMLQKSPLEWMVRTDSEIFSVNQFAAKTIGIHVDGVTGLQYAMKTAGLELTDANVIDVPFEKLDQLRDGLLDVCQCNGLVEPFEMEAAGVPVRVIWAHESGYSVYSQVLSTSHETLEQQDDEISEFMAVLWRGWRAVYENQQAAAKVVFGEFLHETSLEIQRSIIGVMKPFVFGEFRDLDQNFQLGEVSVERLQSSIDLLLLNKVISSPLRAEQLLGR